MAINIKSEIDNHFSANYNYYQRICNKYFSGNDLQNDLLHELYIRLSQIPEQTIKRYIEAKRLHNIGLLTIKKIYSERYKVKTKSQAKCSKENYGSTSPLYTSPDVLPIIIESTPSENEPSKAALYDSLELLKNNHYFCYEILILTTEVGQTKAAKQMKLTKVAYKQHFETAKQLLKKQLLQNENFNRALEG